LVSLVGILPHLLQYRQAQSNEQEEKWMNKRGKKMCEEDTVSLLLEIWKKK
jgi:hypothetical protein